MKNFSKEGKIGAAVAFAIAAWFYLNDISSSQFMLLVPVAYMAGYYLGTKKPGKL